MPRKALFLVNPASGKRQSREPLFDAGRPSLPGGLPFEHPPDLRPGDATETARKEGPDYVLVLCSGGDGIL